MIQAVNKPNILEHISGLTSQRDFDLLNFSLLKSLTALLPKCKFQTLAVSPENQIVKQLKYVSDRLKISLNATEIDEAIVFAVIRTHRAGFDKTVETIDNHSLALFSLIEENACHYYLSIVFPREVKPADDYLIRGVLEIYKNFGALLIAAQTDELTGLSNRKTFESTIHRLHDVNSSFNDVDERARKFDINDRRQRLQRSDNYWICAIDIDHFKAVNDNFGHLYGDEVLVRVAQILRSTFRLNDMLFRFGGEEFIALVNIENREDVEVLLERVRSAIESMQVSKVGTITISMGVVEFDPNVFYMTLMHYADQALYHSKRSGRNRLTFFEDLLKEGKAKLETFEDGEIELF